ncbi:MAG: transcription-repair coupling factor [Armatimonadia bacterium]
MSVTQSSSAIGQLKGLIEGTHAFREIAQFVHEGQPVCAEGVSGGGKSFFCASLLADPGKSALILTFNDERATQLAGDLRAFLDSQDEQTKKRVLVYPSVASALYDGVTPERQTIAERLTVLERLCCGEPIIVVAAVRAIVTLTVPSSDYVAARREIAVGEIVDRDELARALYNLGYESVDLVDDVGQFSVRGGIIDVSPPTSPHPLRIELFGDEIESIRTFDPMSQRSLYDVKQVGLGPAGEILLTDQAVNRALPIIKGAYRRELDRLNEEGKHREASRLTEHLSQDLDLLEQLRPMPHLMHYLPYIYGEPESICSYFPSDAIFFVDEPVRVQAAAEQFEADVHDAYRRGVRLGQHLRLPETGVMHFDKLAAQHLTRGRAIIYLSMLQRNVPWNTKAPLVHLSTPPVDSFGGRFELLAEGLAEWQKEGYHLLVCSRDVDGTVQVLQSRGLKDVEASGPLPELRAGHIIVADLDLDSGFRLTDAKFVLLTGREIFGWRKMRRSDESVFARGFELLSLRDLNEGDYIVHINHGVGIYRGLTRQTVGGIERDYMTLEYADNDKLYVPVTQLDRVQKYIGGEHSKPTITSLKKGRWDLTKKKARRSAQLLARELMRLYSARATAKGHQFKADSPWLMELESSFRYEETPDQLRAIQDVKKDMEKPMPADRLICGDVGYGKTEVAIRAAFKAVLDGKQVAILVPTTVLAHQHYNTFKERLARYPVEVQVLSRFKQPAEQRRIINCLKAGSVDIVVGTHRLLGEDVNFQDLGLLIIDEEQRFGVRQKEKLKRFREGVDVITLTATPIPRTLNMALSGIREISVINDPPQGRLAIHTEVRERDEPLIAEVVRRELARGGQVYFVHNRVHSIGHVASLVQRLVPEARVAVAHGQMEEQDLERVMMAFYAEEFDVLVCTTIIESGLDIPNVNTIVVDDADRLGLAQLYQLRGRVGRSSRQAFAYLLYRYPQRMTQDAEERLKAIEEFSKLGSGFQIALRDLEIRGAGDILGGEQSGHMSAVGLDLYTQMLADAVKALKGDKRHKGEGHPTIDLPLEAVIPADYVPNENQRISLYRRLAAVEEKDQLLALVKEIKDRFGPLPGPVKNLIRIVQLKLLCMDVGVVDISIAESRVNVTLAEELQLSPREQRVITGLYHPTVKQARAGVRSALPRFLVTAHQLSFGYNRNEKVELLRRLTELLDRLRDRQSTSGGTPAASPPATRKPVPKVKT